MGATFGRTPHEILDVDAVTFALDAAGYQAAREQYLEDLQALAKAIWGG